MLVSAAFGAATPLAAAEMATIPYRTVADIFEGFAKVKDKDKLHLAVRVVPVGDTNGPAARPVTLEIPGDPAPVALTVSETGELLDFPLTPALRTANPRIVSNQPKGTLNLRAELTLRYSGRLSENPSWYIEALGQANAAVKNQSGLLSFISPKLTSLLMAFDPAAAASVTLRTDAGEKRFPADARGIVRMPLGAEAARKNARMFFSVAPLKIIAE